MIPQGLGEPGVARHKDGAEALDAIGQADYATALDSGHGLWQQYRRDVANHPQSLWISLWTGFGHERQVALPKGFFFVCSKFERTRFPLRIN
jgi:hypothetical protein